MVGEVGNRVRELIRQVCREQEVEILSGSVSKEHIHVFVSIPPKVTISRLVQRMKGFSSYKLMQEFKHLEKAFWGRHLWARGYFCVSSGQVTDEVIKAYIENQAVEDEENFKVVT
jgi:putative transposase